MIGQVTFNSHHMSMTHSIRDATEQYDRALLIATTAKKVNALGDDPSAYTRILAGRSLNQKLSDYQKTAELTRTEVDQADSVLSTVVDILSRAQELATAGANESTYNSSDRIALAVEVNELKSQLVMSVNARHNGRYIFSGTLTNTAPYDATGVYQGNEDTRKVIVGEGYSMDVSIPGSKIFNGTDGGVDIFQAMDDLYESLSVNDLPGIQSGLGRISTAVSQVATQQSLYGAKSAELSALKSYHETRSTQVTSEISYDEDADIAAAYSDLTRFDTVLNATLQVAAQTANMSLLDFI